jgi:hypothetical protein
MKTLAIVLAAIVLMAGAAVPVALAQQDASSPQAAPQQKAPDINMKGPAVTVNPPAQAPDTKAPDAKVDVNVKRDRSDDAASASPRTDGAARTGFFGLSPTAAIIVSVAVLLVVILAIVAMTNNRTSYVDRDRL